MLLLKLLKLMRTKKRKTTHKRRKRTLSEGLSRKVSRRTHSRRKKGVLSELFSPATATATAKTMVGAGIGGYAYGIVEPTINDNISNPLGRTAVALGLSFVASSVLKMPNVSSGIAGALGYSMARKSLGLSEMNDYDYASKESLNEIPEYLDEAGNPVYLAEDGTYKYMDEMNEEEMEMMDEMGEPVYLAEPIYLADSIYPDYVNTSHY